MPNYRRWRVAGGSYFFTVVTHSRAPLFRDALARRILGEKFRECQRARPFQIPAIVLLPEHLHAIWTLPPGDSDYPGRWLWIKKEFTREWLAAGGEEQSRSAARVRRGDRGVWQPRYWEHTLRDEDDFQRHADYIHYNPVKHRHVASPCEWRASTFHAWVRAGDYETNWGCSQQGPVTFDDLCDSAIELGIE